MADPPQDHDRRQSIGRYVKRLRTVLKRGSSSKDRLPTRPAAAAEQLPTSAADTQPVESKPVASTAGQTSYPRSAAQQERARALFAKYGLTLEAHEWMTTGVAGESVQRVEKPIRMRVRRQCHRCQTTFGPDRVCQKCEHTRCKKCPRYPAKKEKAKEKAKGKEREGGETGAAATTAAAQPSAKLGTKPVKKAEYLTIKSRTGGQDLERRPPKQRVRRTCHRCNALFVPATATICPGCSHARCTKCPRDPAKKKKWPDGYPGDAPPSETETDEDVYPKKPDRTWRRPRQRVRWSCEECQTLYMEKSKQCTMCGHERCQNCTRIPPKKVKKEPDPEVVRAVEEKLARFKIDDTPSVTATTT